MTTTADTPGLTPGQRRTVKARETRSRASEQRWAEHLRGRGWAVVQPELADQLKTAGVGHGGPGHDECLWCAGYATALNDVLGDAGSPA